VLVKRVYLEGFFGRHLGPIFEEVFLGVVVQLVGGGCSR
jgi:hypothetical protein